MIWTVKHYLILASIGVCLTWWTCTYLYLSPHGSAVNTQQQQSQRLQFVRPHTHNHDHTPIYAQTHSAEAEAEEIEEEDKDRGRDREAERKEREQETEQTRAERDSGERDLQKTRGVDHPIRIAYVFAGSARSFICPKVHWSLRLNVIDAFGGEPYVFVRVSEEDNQNTKTGKGKIWSPKYDSSEVNETLKILNPRRVQYFKLSNQQDEMKINFPSTIHRVFRENDLRRYSMFYHRCMGYRLVREWEEEHGIRFDWVALIRLDAAWLEPVLPIQYYANDRVWLTETGYVPFNDQFMLIPRQFSDYLYDLNTKVRKEVYCLGGPDVEKWKCNSTELTARGKSSAEINETLTYCCKDVFERDWEGLSEFVHFKHLLQGDIPISMARFTVYLTRLFERSTSRECYGDCPRLHYHFKAENIFSYFSEYPFWKSIIPVDTRLLAIDSTDSGKCGFATNPIFHWHPITAMDYHSLQLNGSLAAVDYSKNLYHQYNELSPSIRLNPNELQIWEIHPVTVVGDCLTFYFENKTLGWEPCIRHLRLKAGRRHDPTQSFHVLVQPPYESFYKHPSVNDEDLIVPFHKMQLANVTRVMILDRDPIYFDLRLKLFCITIVGEEPKTAKVVMELCNVKNIDPRQWFFTITGKMLGSHDHSVIDMLRSFKFPHHCVQRAPTQEAGITNKVRNGEFRLGECGDGKPVLPAMMRFEFVLVQS